jgi:hypothetical protein
MSYFTQTSDSPYDKHDYKLIYKNKKSKTFDNYHDLMQEWHSQDSEILDTVIVLDKKSKNSKSKKGFKL